MDGMDGMDEMDEMDLMDPEGEALHLRRAA